MSVICGAFAEAARCGACRQKRAIAHAAMMTQDNALNRANLPNALREASVVWSRRIPSPRPSDFPGPTFLRRQAIKRVYDFPPLLRNEGGEGQGEEALLSRRKI